MKENSCLGAFRKRVAHDIGIAANRALLSKAVKAVGILTKDTGGDQ